MGAFNQIFILPDFPDPPLPDADGLQVILLGHYQPDELEPTYKAISVPTSSAARIRIRYKRRNLRFASLMEPIHLRSRLAIESMLRAIKSGDDPRAAVMHEARAEQLLGEEQRSSNPTETFTLQFASGAGPGFENVS